MFNTERESIVKTFCDVLQDQAFMFGDEADASEFEDEPTSVLQASVEFDGPLAGKIVLVAPQAFANELASNLLSLDPTDPNADEIARDAFGELANVSTGQLLTTIAGDDPVFKLTPPVVTTLDVRSWKEKTQEPASIAFWVDENPVLVQLISNTAA